MRPALSYDALRQVVFEQQDEINKIKQQQWIERSALKEFTPLLEKSWVKVVRGVRRSGKSIFSHLLLKNTRYGYVNFDDERFIGVSHVDFDKILQFILECVPNPEALFFDEVQNIPGWELFINRLQRQGYNIVITGSNSNLLAKELATHLTGRYIPIEIFPFSFKEFLLAKNFAWDPKDFYKITEKAALCSFLKEYLFQGGFPQLVIEGYDANYLRELYDKIISRDITNRYRLRFSQSLREIAIYCHANLGENITFHKMKNLFGYNSVNTIKSHFQYLDHGYLVFLLDTFDFEYKEQVKQPRKVYTIDNGLSAAINPKFNDDPSKALENLVFQELYRRGESIAHHDIKGMEVNFVVHTNKEPRGLIHIFWSLHNLHINKKMQKAFIKGSEHLKCKHHTIITWDDEGQATIEDLTIQIIPIWKWLLMGN